MDWHLVKNHPVLASATSWSSICLRAVEIWLVISVVEVIHGVARVTFLQPFVGDLPARQIGVFSGSALILAVAFFFRDWIHAKTYSECLTVGAIWVLLTLGFEIVLGRFLMHLTWERIFSDYDLRHGGLMPIGLAIMFFAPLVASRSGAFRTRASSST